MVWCGSENGYQKGLCFRETGLRAQNTITALGSIVNIIEGDLCDRSMSTIMFTLIMNKMITWAPKIIRQTLMTCLPHMYEIWKPHTLVYMCGFQTSYCLEVHACYLQEVEATIKLLDIWNWLTSHVYWCIVFANNCDAARTELVPLVLPCWHL